MPFQIKPLPQTLFQDLFALNADELKSRLAVRMVADRKPGFPCRISLADAEVGEEVLLVNYFHQPANSPYRSSHAVFVRPDARQAQCEPNEIPEFFRLRTLSLRAFDHSEMMISADLAEGIHLEQSLNSIFSNSAVAHIHIHFAKPGCYAARADRL